MKNYFFEDFLSFEAFELAFEALEALEAFAVLEAACFNSFSL